MYVLHLLLLLTKSHCRSKTNLLWNSVGDAGNVWTLLCVCEDVYCSSLLTGSVSLYWWNCSYWITELKLHLICWQTSDSHISFIRQQDSRSPLSTFTLVFVIFRELIDAALSWSILCGRRVKWAVTHPVLCEYTKSLKDKVRLNSESW